jgi:hypothetical protein
VDAHIPLNAIELKNLDLILSKQEIRRVQKNLTLQYKNKLYQILLSGQGHRLRQAAVTVCESCTGEITLLYKTKALPYIVYDTAQQESRTATAKELNDMVDHIKTRRSTAHTPASNHPWRLYRKG